MRIDAPATAGVVAAAIALTGCGGGGGVSKTDYVKQANGICAGYNTQVRRVSQESFPPIRSTRRPPPPSVAKFQAFLGRLVPLTEAELRKLRALKKPKGDGATIDAIYAEVDKGLATLRRGQTDPAVVRKLEGRSNPFAAANRRAKAYGLTDCGG